MVIADDHGTLRVLDNPARRDSRCSAFLRGFDKPLLAITSAPRKRNSKSTPTSKILVIRVRIYAVVLALITANVGRVFNRVPQVFI
jgi:hypothetical protein